jgi:hypothetical protein
MAGFALTDGVLLEVCIFGVCMEASDDCPLLVTDREALTGVCQIYTRNI